MNKVTDKVKRLIGHNSFLDLCSYSYSARKQKKTISNENPVTGKKRLVWYAGRMSTNGMTTSLCNLIGALGCEEYEHIVMVLGADAKMLKKRQQRFDPRVSLVPFDCVKPTISEVATRASYFSKPREKKSVWKKLETMYRRNATEVLEALSPDVVIQFTGYDRDAIALFSMANCKRLIFVHNDKTAEIAQDKGEDAIFLRHFLPLYDVVIPVTIDIAGGVSSLGVHPEKIHVVNNLHDDEKVKKMAQAAICFGNQTRSTISLDRLQDLFVPEHEMFITIGRFVPQKGHELLLKAFARYEKEHKNAYLIIIGGYGRLYEATQSLVEELGLDDKVVLIRQMDNPMPILKQCQLFILSSLFEGQGLVLLEAASLKVPLFSTNVNGPRGFLAQHGGLLVSPTEEGIYQGMLAYEAGKIQPIQIDFKAYNEKCLQDMKAVL